MMGWVWLVCLALCSGRLALAAPEEDRGVLLRVLRHQAAGGAGRQLADAGGVTATATAAASAPAASVVVPAASSSSVAPASSEVPPAVPSFEDPAGEATLRRRVAEAASPAPSLMEDGKKTKKNSTLGEEVITTLIDGWSGESEDAKFGSEIREQFGFLVQAVTKLGAAAIDEYAKPSRASRAVDNVGEGRRRQVRRLLVRYLVLLKVFALGIILPGAVLLALLQSWKAVTLALMALLLAGVIGIRGLVTSAAKGQTAEVIHTTGPGGHYWRRVSAEQAQDPDRLAYSAYVPVN